MPFLRWTEGCEFVVRISETATRIVDILSSSLYATSLDFVAF